jgi:hypothetical protein
MNENATTDFTESDTINLATEPQRNTERVNANYLFIRINNKLILYIKDNDKKYIKDIQKNSEFSVPLWQVFYYGK